MLIFIYGRFLAADVGILVRTLCTRPQGTRYYNSSPHSNSGGDPEPSQLLIPEAQSGVPAGATLDAYGNEFSDNGPPIHSVRTETAVYALSPSSFRWFALHGNQDNVVPVRDVRPVYDFANATAENAIPRECGVRVVKGHGHTIFCDAGEAGRGKEDWQQVLQDCVAWVEKMVVVGPTWSRHNNQVDR